MNDIKDARAMQYYLFRNEAEYTAVSVEALNFMPISDDLGEPCFDFMPVEEAIVRRLVERHGGRVLR